MRVLHVHSGNLYGGVETMLTTLARRRDACPEMEPHFALCFEGRLSEELVANGARVHRLPNVRVSRPSAVLRARRSLAALLRDEKFDVVICHSAWSHAVFAKVVRAAGLPLVFWSHDAASGTHWLERWARRTPPDLAVCNSVYTARSIRSFFPSARAEVVYCPLDLPDLAPYRTHASRAAVRAELHTPLEAAVIIQVSRMEAWKGHSPHLQALGLLKGLDGWVCWFVGGSQRPGEVNYAKLLEAEAGRLGLGGRVRFLGARRDVSRLLAASDIFCQPNTRGEPFGLVFVEALAAGLPVVTTDLGAAAEIIDGTCGLLVAPADPRALAAALRSLIESASLRSELGAHGPQRARNLCEVEPRFRDIHVLLAGALAGVGGGESVGRG
jgi:glycosyltransferase involved in cell wall biosynthesis